MSKESVQFTEMVRQADAELKRRQEQPQTYNMYCEECGVVCPHTISTRGQYEVYTCPKGHQKEYRVG